MADLIFVDTGAVQNRSEKMNRFHDESLCRIRALMSETVRPWQCLSGLVYPIAPSAVLISREEPL